MPKWSYRTVIWTGYKVKIIRKCFGSNLEVRTTCEEFMGKKGPARLNKKIITRTTIKGVSSDLSKDTITSKRLASTPGRPISDSLLHLNITLCKRCR